MLYVHFVLWLIRKSDRWFTRLQYGDWGVYTRQYEHVGYGSLAQLGRYIIFGVFVGGPLALLLELIYLLPITPLQQWLVTVAAVLVIFGLTARVLIKYRREL